MASEQDTSWAESVNCTAGWKLAHKAGNEKRSNNCSNKRWRSPSVGEVDRKQRQERACSNPLQEHDECEGAYEAITVDLALTPTSIETHSLSLVSMTSARCLLRHLPRRLRKVCLGLRLGHRGCCETFDLRFGISSSKPPRLAEPWRVVPPSWSHEASSPRLQAWTSQQ